VNQRCTRPQKQYRPLNLDWHEMRLFAANRGSPKKVTAPGVTTGTLLLFKVQDGERNYELTCRCLQVTRRGLDVNRIVRREIRIATPKVARAAVYQGHRTIVVRHADFVTV
jgi:hypothetical protein